MKKKSSKVYGLGVIGMGRAFTDNVANFYKRPSHQDDGGDR